MLDAWVSFAGINMKTESFENFVKTFANLLQADEENCALNSNLMKDRALTALRMCYTAPNDEAVMEKVLKRIFNTFSTADQVPLGAKVKDYHSHRTGVIIANTSRQGNEIVAVEWDDNFIITAFNINDLVFL